jgi:hypothetical protein
MTPTMRRLYDNGSIVALIIAVFYVWKACPYIVENDTAEFATLGTTGGIAHPSGYPAYVLWLRLFAWLPSTSPAHTAALATVIVAVLQVLVLHAACRAWGARPAAANLAVASYGLVPLVARYNTQAEAFAFNSLVVVLVLWMAAPRAPVRGVYHAFLLGVIAGLGLANHMTCAVVAPIGLLGVVLAGRQSKRLFAWSAAFGGLLVGLTPYLYLFIAAQNPLSWPRPTDLGELVDIVLRRQFGGPFGFTGFAAERPWVEHLVALAESLAVAWWWVGLPVALVALIARCARPQEHGTRGHWFMLATSFVLAGPLLVTRFDVTLNMFGRYVAERFHLLPILLLVIPASAALDVALARIRRGWLEYVLLIAMVVAGGVRALPYLARFQSPALENEVTWVISTAPPGAIMIGRDDELDVGARYVQLARGIRPDVTYIRWGSMALPWYRAQFPDIPYAGLTGDLKQDVVQAALATNRPLLVHPRELAGLHLPGYPHGILLRMLPRGTDAPRITEVLALNLDLFGRLDLEYPRPGPADQYATWVHRNYAKLWQVLGDALMREGYATQAEAAYALMHDVAPR